LKGKVEYPVIVCGRVKPTRHILIPSEWCNNAGAVREVNLVVVIGRVQALQHSNGRVKDNVALDAGLDERFDLLVINEIEVDILDVGGRLRIKVC
jgi:hypothetical protein